MSEPTKLLDGGTFFEGPRWHDGCWWVSDFYTDGGRIVAVDPGGAIVREIPLEQPSGLGWLPNGDLLAVSMSTHKIWRIADGAEPVLHADLAGHSRGESNDMTVDAQGRVWVDSFGYDLYAGERPVGAALMRVDPDGSIVPVADGLHFPNSIMVAADGGTLVVAETIASRLTAFDVAADGTLSGRRVYCQIAPTVPLDDIAADYSNVSYGPDGCTLDAEGCVWAGNSLGDWVGRFSPAGEVLQRIDAPGAGMAAYAVQLGGADGRTLLLCVAPDWRKGMGDDSEPRASLWTVEVDVPHHGGRPLMGEGFDTIVIGGGPGGYVAAIRAAQLGQKVAVVERDKAGGRCLNYACIPAKTMLRTAEIYADVKNGAELGIVGDVAIDWDALQARRAKVSESLSGGVQFLWDKNKVTLIEGEGALTPDGDVKVGDEVYAAKAVVLATGSVALPIPGAPFGGRVVDTWGAWSLPAQPRRIAVVGAGASGSELASAYSRLGTEVLLIEMLPQILPAEDVDIAKVVERAFKRGGIEISTGAPVENVEVGSDSVKFTYGEKSAEVDYLCVAGGRGSDTEGLGLAAAGVELDEGGRKIKVDGFGRTTNPKVFAIGDLVHRKALAHKAEEEGVVAVEAAAGVETEPVDQGLLVGATFTHPQVASVGLTEEAARAAGLDVKVGKQKISGEGAGTVYDDKDGLVKLVVDYTYGEVVGAHIVGNRACDMIAELVATMALEGGYQELSRIVHPHPTVSEAVLDAARAVDGWAIHA